MAILVQVNSIDSPQLTRWQKEKKLLQILKILKQKRGVQKDVDLDEKCNVQ